MKQEQKLVSNKWDILPMVKEEGMEPFKDKMPYKLTNNNNVKSYKFGSIAWNLCYILDTHKVNNRDIMIKNVFETFPNEIAI